MRFPQITEPTELQKQVARDIAEGPRGKVGGAYPVLLHNAALASHLQKFGAYLRFETTLAGDLRALAILVTSAFWRCNFEWEAHARYTRTHALLADPVIESIGRGEVPEDLTAAQAAVHRFCIAMHRGGIASDEEFADAVQVLGHAGVLDLIAVCGYFALLAMVLNASRLPLPEGASLRF